MSSILVDAASTNYKSEYCKNKEFVTSGKKTPHLHCSTTFFLLKPKGGVHVYFAQKNVIRCAKLFEVLEDPDRFGAFYKIAEIEKSMMNFANNECNRNKGERKLYENALVVYKRAKAASKNKMSKNKKYSQPNRQNKKFGKGQKKKKNMGNNQQCGAIK